MTDIRAALEALYAEAHYRPDPQWPAGYRVGLLDGIAKCLSALDALAAASPEPERCACGCLLSQHSAPHDVPDQTICHGCSGDRCGQPALAAASPEPERCATCGQSRDGLKHRCWSTHFRRVREAGDGLHVTTDCHPFQSAPAAPTVEALRDALAADLAVLAFNLRHPSTHARAKAMVLERLDAIIAAARADERTRLSGETPSRIHLLGMLASMEWVQPMSNSSPSCPWCGSQKHFGHGQGCSLATAISEHAP